MNEMSEINENNEPLISRQMVWVGGAAVAIMFGIAAWAWGRVEPPIPVHWDGSGNPDRYGGKFEGLMVLPLVTAGITALLLFLPSIAPRQNNLARSRKAYQISFYALLLFMIGLQTMTVRSIMGDGGTGNMAQLILVGVGLLFMVIGNSMSTIRSNHFFGIRTPWTLSSDYAWRKTHRVGGWMFMGIGIMYILFALFSRADEMMGMLILVSTVGMTLFLMGYSYWVWRNDPERTA